MLLALALPLVAAADGRRLTLPAGSAKDFYAAECGSCHIAYPPQLLSGPRWQRVMAGLEKHFGVDASVDAKTKQAVGVYLAANAGAARRFGSDGSRISATAWFRREHHEVPDAIWKSPQSPGAARGAAVSAADCAACHPDAARGDFSERGVRIPAAVRPSRPAPDGEIR